MISDTIKNKDLYTAISPRIKAGLDYIAKTDFSVMEAGRYELDGTNLYVLVQKYDSLPKDQGKWECHRNYIDIQYIADGVELIGFTNIANMQTVKEYNPEKDIAYLSGNGDYVTLTKGSYGIFFPGDAHQPKVAPGDKPGAVVKVVVKVKI
ncbi:MAG TPA: YhcH/YjgK/YiaL family protein [Bacteroidales bacterium]|jgi:YhcH/YjgK/YiaL family protein|nr:YhcH/YjgK/YiaL family protein [Bacteroidales bacterium]